MNGTNSTEGPRFYRTKSQCTLCALQGCRKVHADLPPEGAKGLAVVLSEAPGEAEDRLGHVLIGPAGSFFNWALSEAGIRRDRLWLTNVICCRPPRNDIKSPDGLDAVASCATGLHEELRAAWDRGYRIILAQGQTALDALGIAGKATTLRGSILEGSVLEGHGFPPFRVVCTVHPSHVLQSQWDMRLTYISDLQKLKEVAEPSWRPAREDFLLEPGTTDVLNWLDDVPEGHLLGLDTETDGLSRYYSEIVCLSLARSRSDVLSLPWRLRGRDDLYYPERDRQMILEALVRTFDRTKLVLQNAAFDVPFMRLKLCNVPLKAVEHDTYLLHSLISPETPHNLGFITSIYGTTPYWKDDFKNRPGSIYEMEPRDLWTYNARDSSVLLQCLDKMLQDLKEFHLEDQYYGETMPLFREAVMEMIEEGVNFDYPRMDAFKEHMSALINERYTTLRQQASLPEVFDFTPGLLQWFFFGKRPEGLDKKIASLAEHEAAIAKVQTELEAFEKGLEGTKMTPKGREKAIALKQKSLERKKGLRCLDEERKAKVLSDEVRPLFVISGYDGKKTKTGDFSTDKDSIINLKGRVERELAIREDRMELHDKALHSNALSAAQRHQHEDWNAKAEAEAEALERLATFIDIYQDLSGLEKLLDAFTKYRAAPDGHIHPWWDAGGTATGRFSCREPNLMQLPKGDEAETASRAKTEALEVRRFFTCEPGYGYASADLQNAEVAMFGYETGDPGIIETYMNKGKIHNINAKILFDIEPDDDRFAAAKAAAKIFQFGRYQYGGTLRTVMRQMRVKAPGLRVTMAELEAADARWWAAHPAVKAWSDRVEAEVREKRLIYNAFGRMRAFLGEQNAIGRAAKSFLVQGGIGSVVNKATLRIQLRKKTELPNARLVMQYHDQLVYKAPLGPELDRMCQMLSEELERPFMYRGVERMIRAEVEYSHVSFGDLRPWTGPDAALTW